jgi:hypothetical protein
VCCAGNCAVRILSQGSEAGMSLTPTTPAAATHFHCCCVCNACQPTPSLPSNKNQFDGICIINAAGIIMMINGVSRGCREVGRTRHWQQRMLCGSVLAGVCITHAVGSRPSFCCECERAPRTCIHSSHAYVFLFLSRLCLLHHQAACRLLGYEKGELDGKNVSCIM